MHPHAHYRTEHEHKATNAPMLPCGAPEWDPRRQEGGRGRGAKQGNGGDQPGSRDASSTPPCSSMTRNVTKGWQMHAGGGVRALARARSADGGERPRAGRGHATSPKLLMNCSLRSEEKRPMLGCWGPGPLSARWPSRAPHSTVRATSCGAAAAAASPGRHRCGGHARRPARGAAAAAARCTRRRGRVSPVPARAGRADPGTARRACTYAIRQRR